MSIIHKPGDMPPDIVPFCARCDMPVESFRLDLMGGDDRIGIHARCCGQESSTRITLETYRQMLVTGAKLVVIVRKGSQAGLRARKSTLRSISH